jgi:hypothetical protein
MRAYCPNACRSAHGGVRADGHYLILVRAYCYRQYVTAGTPPHGRTIRGLDHSNLDGRPGDAREANDTYALMRRSEGH